MLVAIVILSVMVGLHWRAPAATPIVLTPDAGAHRLGALNSSVYGYRTIQQDGGAVTQRDTLNFLGSATVADDPTNGVTDVTITGGSSDAGTPEPKLFPYVDLIAAIGGTADGPGFSATTAGVYFSPNVVGSVILGVRFYWVAPSGGAIDVKCSLWQNSVSLGTGTAVAVPTGINKVTFTAPYTVQAGDLALPFVVSTYAPGGSGGYYCNVNGAFQTICNSQSNNTVPVAPVLASPLWRYQGGDNTPENVFGLSATGAEQQPTTKYGQSTYFAIEPVFQ